MSAAGTLSGGAAGLSGLLRLRRRAAPAPAIAAPSLHPAGTIKCTAVPDAAPIVWGRQLRPALLLPAALLPSSQPAKKHNLRPAAAAAESAGSLTILLTTYHHWMEYTISPSSH